VGAKLQADSHSGNFLPKNGFGSLKFEVGQDLPARFLIRNVSIKLIFTEICCGWTLHGGQQIRVGQNRGPYVEPGELV
jgi:hypothetical protein